MTDYLSGFLDIINAPTSSPFSFKDLSGFPSTEYYHRQQVYTECEYWYTGQVLEETVMRAGEAIETYPVRANPLPGAVQKHVASLFGISEVEEDDRPLVIPRVVPKGDDDAEKEAAKKAEDVLYEIWYESSGRGIQYENGACSQIYGGCVFKVNYDPLDGLRSNKVRIESIHPKYFVGRPDATDYFKLREAWIVKPISYEEALTEHGVAIKEDYPNQTAWLVEHWTLTKIEVTVNNVPAKRQLADGTWKTVTGPNPWGFIPIVYIPHTRSYGFYGENLFDNVKGIVKELNLRIADYGDAVSVDSHSYLGMRNVQGAPTIQQLAPGLNVVNLQSTPNISGQEPVPDIFELRKPLASAPMGALVVELYDQYRRDAFIPKVADGEDEGSQRSGLTLAMRMLPLVWHTCIERVFWTTGMNLLNRMVLKICAIKKEAGITIEQSMLRIKQEWSPVLPRDQEMLVNEIATLVAAKSLSIERAVEMQGVDDINEERELILSFWEELEKRLAKVQAEYGPQLQQPFGGKPSSSSSSASSASTKATANQSTE